MLASRTARWSAGAALACLLLLAGTWFLLIEPRREHVAETRAEQVLAEQANDLLRTKVNQLRAQFADLPKTRAELAAIQTQLTPAANLSELVRSVSALAADSGTDLVSITPGTAASLADALGKGTIGGTTGGTTGAATAGKTGTSQAGANVVAIPVSIVATGDYFQAVGFVRRLQVDMPRALLVGSLTIDQDDSKAKNSVRLTLAGQVFTLPPASQSGSGTSAGAAASAGTSGSSGSAATGSAGETTTNSGASGEGPALSLGAPTPAATTSGIS